MLTDNNHSFFGQVFRPRRFVRLVSGTLRSLGKQKVFCIGKNKTGTTSLKKALEELGFIVGDQTLGEHLIHDWATGDFSRLFLYCQTAQAFQDHPFSLPKTYKALDQKFPGSKFILTTRDTPEQWFRSLVNYHSKIFGNGNIPTVADLKAAKYVYPGWAFDVARLTRNAPLQDLYNKEILIQSYNDHNSDVMGYFIDRPEDLLVLNVGKPNAYHQLCDFLGKPDSGKDFPWENKGPEEGVIPAQSQ